MRQSRIGKPVEDKRTRHAIKRPGTRCIEMHCEARERDHAYGDPGCTWVQLTDRSVISRQEAIETTTRPDRIARES